jgi:zinc protease
MPLRMTTTVLAGCLIAATATAATSDRWNLPIATKQLDNGLTVVVSEDHSSPTVGISVIYKVGIRTEPRGRTGFAHLFEHLMFEGTPNAAYGVFDRVVTDGGGDNNGSTHPDFTSYIERAPVSALEPLLWLEADRMKALAFSQKNLDGQRDVVKEEINVNVKNQPYGGFAESDLPLLAFQKWENGHDGYGSFDDLDKASLDDVRGFHRDFYGPNNAVLGIAGDVTPEQGFALAKKYFGAIPARSTPPRPDVDEPLNAAGKRLLEGDALARLPALAVGWKMPPRGSKDQAAMIVLGELLAGDDASRLYQSLVKGSALALQIDAFTGSGSPWEYDGPTLYTLMIVYKADGNADDKTKGKTDVRSAGKVDGNAAAVLAAIDEQIARIGKEGVDPAMLQGVKTRMLADWYDGLEPFVDRAETLAILQAVWGDAKIASQVPDLIDGVTSADIQRVAGTYLTDANRSIIDRVPDFMLPPGDPARSDLRAKAKPQPALPTGHVSVGKLETVNPPAATAAPAAPAAAKPLPATPPVGKPESGEPPPASPASPASDKHASDQAPPVGTVPVQVVAAQSTLATPVPAIPASTNAAPVKPPSGDAHQAQTPTPAVPAATKPEAAKPAPSKPEAAKPAAPKPDASKPEASKPEVSKPGVPKSEVPKAASRSDASKPEAPKVTATKSDTKKPAASPTSPASPASPASDTPGGTH